MADDLKDSALDAFSGTLTGIEGVGGFRDGGDFKFLFGTHLPYLVNGTIPDVFMPPLSGSGGALWLLVDQNTPPVPGEVVVYGAAGATGRTLTNIWTLFEPLPIDFATPLIFPVGAVVTNLCREVETDGDLELGDPIGTPLSIVPGLSFEFKVINGGTDDLVEVPASWNPGQAETPALAQGAGAVSRIIVKIEAVTIDADEVTITDASYFVIPGPDTV